MPVLGEVVRWWGRGCVACVGWGRCVEGLVWGGLRCGRAICVGMCFVWGAFVCVMLWCGWLGPGGVWGTVFGGLCVWSWGGLWGVEICGVWGAMVWNCGMWGSVCGGCVKGAV